ncbi:Smr/MutS family protein [Riemerella columbina]|uniref:Smr/MutS family protein n=1 Tax=Riemerella columbina TaxID=103810 RepID=UPI000372B330|nr:Smr/MutS family protein [Riemerella columbina]
MKVGDTVSVIDEAIRGVITSIHEEEIVFQDEYGFKHFYSKNEVVIVKPEIYQAVPIEKKPEPQPKKAKKKTTKHLVLDLHFDQLVNDPHAYESFERLLIQREKLEDTLEFCRTHRIKKLEIIHGIGDGILQQMVYDILRSKADLDFDDDGFFYHQSGSVWVEWK